MIILFLIFTIILLTYLLILCIKNKESFYLSKTEVSKYMKEKQNELVPPFSKKAWDYCSIYMEIALKLSPNIKEVPMIQTKEFPCGNSPLKCLQLVQDALDSGKEEEVKIDLNKYLPMVTEFRDQSPYVSSL
jgi:hypothetical protein